MSKNAVVPEAFDSATPSAAGNPYIKQPVKKYFWVILAFAVLFLIVSIVLAILLGLNLKRQNQATSTPDVFSVPTTSPQQPDATTTATTTARTATTTARTLPEWPEPSISPMGKYYHAAVAADNGYCSEIGRNVLLDGGNAVDAAVATVVCIGVMDAHSSGIGGGHFMTIYNKNDKSCTIIDAREVAPLAANETMYVNNSRASSTLGWTAIAVPGELHGLWTAYSTKGSGNLSWASLLRPTIDLLQNGYPVSTALALAIENKRNIILNETTLFSILFNNATGDLYKAGDVMKRPVLAKTLEDLASASNPAALFYNGSIARDIAREFQHYGGIITDQDFRRYSSTVRPAVVTVLSDEIIICGPPPPSSSAVTQAIVNIMAGYNIVPYKNLTTFHQNVMTYHKFIESMKFAYADRSLMGDMSFINSSFQLAQNITSPSYAKFVRSKITDRAHNSAYYGGGYSSPDHGTSHISVMDEAGNAVAVTTTINTYFGSKRRSPSTGVIWNNEMDDFSTPGVPNYFGYPPSPSNYIKAGKRPMSSMSPIVFFNNNTGKADMVVGAAGGSRIISATAYTTLRALWFNETIKQAVDARRIHNQLRPNYTRYESGFPQAYVATLDSLGQDMTFAQSAGSVVTAIKRGTDGFIYANSDWRKGPESRPAGY